MAALRYKPAKHYTKQELDNLISLLKCDDSKAIKECVAFTLTESFGLWHNRARAKICRNLKNRQFAPDLKQRLVSVIINRLETGRFYEQFKDQLAMAIRFDPVRMQAAAEGLNSNETDYIRRYAFHVLQSIRSTQNKSR